MTRNEYLEEDPILPLIPTFIGENTLRGGCEGDSFSSLPHTLLKLPQLNKI